MKKQMLLAGVAGAVLLVASPALARKAAPAAQPAQDAPKAPEATEDEIPGDIVVTAQKRNERLQDVPIAVSVVSGAALDRAGVVNIENAQYLVPSLNFRKSGTTLNQSLFLRGVGTSTFSIAGEPSIATVVDGVVYQRSGEAFSDLIDIDRLEVLRGPQGTLFGKNTSAGAINIVTKRPGDTLAGFAEASYFGGNGNEYRVRGAIDVPISDKVTSRWTAFYGTYDGNIFNQAVNQRVNGYNHWGIRGMVVAKPTNDVTLTLIGDYRKSRDNCCAELIGTAPAATNALAVQLVTGGALPAQLGDLTRTVNQNLVTRTNEESWGFSLQADIALGSHTLTSITAYRNYANEEIRDGDWVNRAYVGTPQLHDRGPQTGDTFTQEIRLASPTGRLIDYVVGVFYSHAYSRRVFQRDVTQCTLTPAPTVLTPCGAPGTVVTTPTGTAIFGSTFKNYAFFGQATLNITKQLRLIGGLRFTRDELSVSHVRNTPLAGPGIQPSFGPFFGNTSNNDISGKIGIQYEIVPESTAYFTYSRGYKGPAFNTFFNLTATGTNVIEPETANSFELGLKNSLFGGKLIVNVAAFYAQYFNFQANNPDLVAGVVVTRFTNAGTVSTRGVELDMIYRPTADLSFNGGFAYTAARVDAFRLPTGGNVIAVVPNGTQLAYAPEVKATLGGNYRWRTRGFVDVEFNMQGSYQSSQLSQFDASAAVRAATTIRPYALVDASVALVDPKDRFRLSFLVKNLLDESFAAAITSGGPGGSFRYIIPREADRYFGITGRVNF
ncbi:TonB-dependent receptor [Sphingomonas sp.]|uniref:TonB-dependent receptor n=1 Tax=Sphingomonas sp. TaxID=28214 RepID=UPI001D3E0EA9|nr:TonB-dependent receptor [Sphingomonas sp.]MBX9797352.1 TonB-dependent receptor [Sphingomonas sp.]